MYLPFEPGKLTEEVKTHLPDATKLMMSRKAKDLGMNSSEYLRDLVCIAVHGMPYDELMIEHRRLIRAQSQGIALAQFGASTGTQQGQALKESTTHER